MLKHGVISTITFDEGTFVVDFRVTAGKRRGKGKGAQGKPGGEDLGGEAHIGKR